jgi:hypothetical protein
MIVVESQLASILDELHRCIDEEVLVGLDTETYGLDYSDKLFSLILSTPRHTYYFNFNDNPDHLGKAPPAVVPRDWLEILPISALFISSHNALYDMQKLALDKVALPDKWHCTMTTERIFRNDRTDDKYSLDETAKRYGFRKSGDVQDSIEENKLYTMITLPGKKQKKKNKLFDLVPLNIIGPYGEIDGTLHRTIGEAQRRELGL